MRYNWKLSVDVCFEMTLEETANVNGVGYAAGSFICESQSCIMIGERGPVNKLLKKAAKWLEHALSHDEYLRFRPGFAEYYQNTFFSNLALCKWFLTNEHDQQHTVRAGEFLGQAITKKQHRHIPDGEAYECLLCFLEAGDAANYVKWHRMMKPEDPMVLAKASSTASVGFFLAEHWLDGKHDRTELIERIGRFMKALVPRQSPSFNLLAHWVKLLHWHLLGENDQNAIEVFGQYRQYLKPE
jgi:hypothetical protein